MVTVSQVSELIAQLSGLAIFAGTLAAIAAFVYRWYVREEIPRGLALLVGLSGVAVYLNTTTALGQVIGGSSAPTEIEVALFNIVAFLAGAGGATLGHRAGDWFGTELFLDEGLDDRESDVGRLVQSVGRAISVELPADIDDVVGYDPIPAETKETLAGKTFMFPRRLTVDELRDRLVTRLKTDYGVGHVDIELAADGTVEYLALGSRAAGIGPTLPPATNAVAIRADPAFAASAGDLVQVWETDPMRRVLTAELRGVAEDTVTIAIDAADTQKIDPTTEYRLVTLPVEDRPDREFASLLRAADETFSSVTVEAGSPLHGLPIGALDLLVVAVKPDAEKPRALADPSTVLAPGDVVFAIARPDALRRLEVAANPLDPALVSGPSTPTQSHHSRQPDDGAATAAPPAEDPSTTDQSARPDADGESETTRAADEAATTADEPETDSEQTDESPDTDDEPETADFDPPAAAASDESDGSDDTTAGKAGGSSFQQLKDEFESGDADWAEGESANGDQSPEREDAASSDAPAETGDSTTDESGFGEGSLDDALAEAGADLAESDSSDGAGDDSDELDVEEADDDLDGLSFGDEGDDDTLDFEEADGGSGSDDLDSLSFDDDADDDLASLSFDEGEDEGLSLDDEGDDEDEEADDEDGDNEEEDSEEDGDDDDDGGGGGGASSFQQLKEEFESGDADWEDDISDSPGGDMRLDE
ncbi:potassium transporter TrkA [Salinibaculum salinum]|uniref:potassium transporter TrkA n=1 Tax=Salinibaculum salinum TaxID=3131996 RepID=UPI0030EB941A